MEQVKPLIEEFVHQYDEEYSEEKSKRRAGRSASTKEDVLKLKIANAMKEYENGFCKHITPEGDSSDRSLLFHRHARPHSH